MTYEDFKKELERAGLSIKDFAAFMKQTPNSITNHAINGTIPAHLAIIAALLADMKAKGIDYRETFSRIQFEASKPRGGSSSGKIISS